MATAQERPTTFAQPSDPETPPEIDELPNYRVILGLSEEMQARVDDLTHRTGYDQAELYNLAIALFKVCVDAVEDGRRVGIVDDDREMFMDLTGFHKNDPAGESL